LKTGQCCFQAKLLVLVPHRDARLPLRAWSAGLFTSGLTGALSFPWLVPIAALRQPIAGAELKSLARLLREHIDKNGGKFTAGRAACTALPGRQVFVCGLELDTGLPDCFFGAMGEMISPLKPLIIGASISESSSFKPQTCPQISFRAAALANMSYRIISLGENQEGCMCEWRIGELYWLPKKLADQT
jgi:hypothetical protein